MKREIKFRAKAINDEFFKGVWVEGYYVSVLMGEEYVDAITDGVHEIPIQIETLGQYSGVKDRDGIEVCEDDIVEWISSDGEYLFDIVAWRYGGLCVCNSQYTVGSYYGLKVKGNKYDNPELLKLIYR